MQTQSKTKLVAVTLVVRTRQEYREVVEVPVDVSDYEMAKIIDARYQAVDHSDYAEDREYWERGECHTEDDVLDNEKPSIVITRSGESPGGELVFNKPVPNTQPGLVGRI